MTISIKHRSGETILQLAQEQHDFVADSYRTLYPVPVKVRKVRAISIGGMLRRRFDQMYAKDFVANRHEVLKPYQY